MHNILKKFNDCVTQASYPSVGLKKVNYKLFKQYHTYL